ncbi:MAG: tetratricopeptide repeat protein [Anaerolineae bacterium]
MNFSDTERRFRELRKDLDAGEIDEQEFEVELRRLQVLDEQGRYWMIGAQSGLWYFYDGEKWVQGEPPTEAAAVPTGTAPAKPPSSPPPTGPKTASAKARRKASNFAVPVVVAVIALCCVLSGVSVVISEFVLPGRPLSSLVASLVGGTPSAPSVGTAPARSPTAAVSANEYVAAGDVLFNDGRYEEAIAQYQMALGVEPQNAEIYSRLGQAYVQLESCDRAVPEFQQALALEPELESAQAGLIECGGSLPAGISFSAYGRSDLSFTLLYPSTWFVREEELQTIFAENEGDIDSLRGNIFFISSLPLTSEEEGMDSMGALIKGRQLIDLPMGSQLGGVEVASFAGWEWATVRGQISGLDLPTTIYIAATVKDANWYGVWAIAPSETWEQVSWPIFRVMANSAQLGQVVAEISPTAEITQLAGTPQTTPEASPQPTATLVPPTPTSPPGASPTARPPTPTQRPAALTGKIAYPRYVGGQTHYEIHIADINGNDLNAISAASEPALDLPGSRIVYRSWDSNFRGLVISGVGGGGKDRPRGGAEPNEDNVPRWSPDGLSLVYATKRFGPHHNSLIRTHSLPQHSELELGLGDTPDWSNDGQRIVVKANVLVVMDRTGGNVRQLTSNPSDSSPDWSPAGSKIAFTRDTGGNWDIWVINADGSGETRLTTDDSVDGLPAWNPEGTHVAFLSNRGGTWAIWVMAADGSGQRKLFNTGCATYATSETFDGEWSGGESNNRRSWMDEQISWSR